MHCSKYQEHAQGSLIRGSTKYRQLKEPEDNKVDIAAWPLDAVLAQPSLYISIVYFIHQTYCILLPSPLSLFPLSLSQRTKWCNSHVPSSNSMDVRLAYRNPTSYIRTIMYQKQSLSPPLWRRNEDHPAHAYRSTLW